MLFWGIHLERLGRQASGESWFHASGRTEVELEGVVIRLREASSFLPGGIFRVSGARQNPEALRGCLVAVDRMPENSMPGDHMKLSGGWT